MDAQRGQSDVSPEAMQARIQQARREAETLKDRIKRKKDELADTTRTFAIAAALAGPSPQRPCHWCRRT
jgi:guanine nucleotide-binding protein G(I)/G(S)/G(T) subunit beta-1